MGGQRKSTADSTAATNRKKPSRLSWLIALAERDASGEWCTVGSPLDGVEFVDQGLAYDYVMKKNRSWNAKFGLCDHPSVAWVAVRSDALGRLAAPFRSAGC
ncbi:MAG: hypothetical protein ACKV19_29700 [Verrucomicrobiales bacterium]